MVTSKFNTGVLKLCDGLTSHPGQVGGGGGVRNTFSGFKLLQYCFSGADYLPPPPPYEPPPQQQTPEQISQQ